MFNCDNCNKTVQPKMKCSRVVVSTREKVYPFRSGVNRVASWKEDKADKINSSNDNGGNGFETVKEIKMCHSCFSEHIKAQS